MTSKGGFCGLSATKRDAHWQWPDVRRIGQEHKPMMALERHFLPRWLPPVERSERRHDRDDV
jgi:hypothetical protein